MARTEFNEDEMVLLYNPGREHKCNLPEVKLLNQRRNIEPRTIMECEECAQRWWAEIDLGNYEVNRWRKLRWYHFVLRSKIG